MAHVLFMDIVAYSTLPMDQQESILGKLQEVVAETPEFAQAQAKDRLIRLPTGDGMALVFFHDPEAPVRCAIELDHSLRKHPDIKLRMGIHSGPVYRIADINANRNVAGGGINIAQRVMDCGDAGHILLSSAEAEVVGQLSSWRPMLHDLGEGEVKHGVRLRLFNLCTQETGNPQRPAKLVRMRQQRVRRFLLPVASTVVIAGALAAWFVFGTKAHALGEADTIVLADFDNKTGDEVFDDTLRQGLSVQLGQSPFLSMISDNKISQTLRLMSRPAGDRLTPDVTKEVCQRTGSRAMLTGSIANLGSQYVIGLKATNCQTGDILAEEQESAKNKETVLKALDTAAVRLRGKLGESLRSVQEYDTPLEKATTPSLEALKAFSLGVKTEHAKANSAALALYKRAVELDPNFAFAYHALSVCYSNLNEQGLAAEYARKAYELRVKVSELERFSIEANYYWTVTGELDKAAQTYELWQQSYPRSYVPYGNLGFISNILGNHEKALREYSEALHLEPNDAVNYSNLGTAYSNLNRLDEEEALYKQADDRKLENEGLLVNRYQLAFLKGDAAQMERLFSAAMGTPGTEDLMLAERADSQAWYGKLQNARELTRRAMYSAEHNGAQEAAATYQAWAALRSVEAGNGKQARADANAAMKLAPNRDVRAMAALALALAGDSVGPEKLASELDKTFPLDTLVQRYWLPPIRAAVALGRKDPNRAVELLRETNTIELGQPNSFVALVPVYVRGKAYLALGDGNEAVAEFQKFVDHRGLVGNFSWGALARLGLARAYALQVQSAQGAGANAGRAKARAAYQDFLTIWKDADPDIPILKEAKAEYAKLQ
jgi:tetratricopeptide (TPR) repeat protein/class 3 adenylate cyclase